MSNMLNLIICVLLFSTLVSSNHHQQPLYQAPNFAYQHYKPRIGKIPSTVPPPETVPASTTQVLTTTGKPVPILDQITVEPTIPESYQGYVAYAGHHGEPAASNPPLPPPPDVEVSSEKEAAPHGGTKKHPVYLPKTESKSDKIEPANEDTFDSIEEVGEGGEASIVTGKSDASPPGPPGKHVF